MDYPIKKEYKYTKQPYTVWDSQSHGFDPEGPRGRQKKGAITPEMTAHFPVFEYPGREFFEQPVETVKEFIPAHVKLDDCMLLLALKMFTPEERADRFEADFDQAGNIRPGRKRIGPGPRVDFNGARWYVIWQRFYPICGEDYPSQSDIPSSRSGSFRSQKAAQARAKDDPSPISIGYLRVPKAVDNTRPTLLVYRLSTTFDDELGTPPPESGALAWQTTESEHKWAHETLINTMVDDEENKSAPASSPPEPPRTPRTPRSNQTTKTSAASTPKSTASRQALPKLESRTITKGLMIAGTAQKQAMATFHHQQAQITNLETMMIGAREAQTSLRASQPAVTHIRYCLSIIEEMKVTAPEDEDTLRHAEELGSAVEKFMNETTFMPDTDGSIANLRCEVTKSLMAIGCMRVEANKRKISPPSEEVLICVNDGLRKYVKIPVGNGKTRKKLARALSESGPFYTEDGSKWNVTPVVTRMSFDEHGKPLIVAGSWVYCKVDENGDLDRADYEDQVAQGRFRQFGGADIDDDYRKRTLMPIDSWSGRHVLGRGPRISTEDWKFHIDHMFWYSKNGLAWYPREGKTLVPYRSHHEKDQQSGEPSSDHAFVLVSLYSDFGGGHAQGDPVLEEVEAEARAGNFFDRNGQALVLRRDASPELPTSKKLKIMDLTDMSSDDEDEEDEEEES